LPKGQSTMNNPEKLATLVTQYNENQNKNTACYVFDSTIYKLTQIGPPLKRPLSSAMKMRPYKRGGVSWWFSRFYADGNQGSGIGKTLKSRKIKQVNQVSTQNSLSWWKKVVFIDLTMAHFDSVAIDLDLQYQDIFFHLDSLRRLTSLSSWSKAKFKSPCNSEESLCRCLHIFSTCHLWKCRYHVHYNNAVRLHVIHMWKGVIVKQETKQKQNQTKRDTTETKRNKQGTRPP
jgi:hypothetical protein